VSRRAQSGEHIREEWAIAIAVILLSLANDLFLHAGAKTSGTRIASGSLT